MSLEQDNINTYHQFLDAFNKRDLHKLEDTFHNHFVDHHPGFELNSLEDYRNALDGAHDTLQIQAVLDEIIAVGDKVITRVSLEGIHVKECFGVEATNNEVKWSTIEIWRVEDGKFVERWAQDDLLGLLKQIGVSLPI